MSKRTGISFIRIPLGLLRLKVRSAHELAILGLAVGFNGHGLRLSNSNLARILDTDRRNIPRVIKRLVTHGYLEVGSDKGRRVLYPTDIILKPLPDIKMTTKRHQNDAKVTSDLPCPSITEGTEGTEGRTCSTSPTPSKKPRPKAKSFLPPTVEHVREYAETQGNPIFDAERFMEYYTNLGWRHKNGKPMQDWERTVRNWIARDNQRRIERGEAPLDGYSQFGTHPATEEELQALEEAGVL